MDHISKAHKYLNQTLLPAHNSASFGGTLKLHRPASTGRNSESEKMSAQNQSKDRENSSPGTTRENQLKDRKPSSKSTHQKAHKKVQRMQLETSPNPNDSKLKQQTLATPEPKV